MAEEAAAPSLKGQFYEFARITESGVIDRNREGNSITLFRSDYWLRQAKVLDDRQVTMVHTGIAFNKYGRSEITFEEWLDHLREVCEKTGIDFERTKELLTTCGLPGQTAVAVPQFREYFENRTPKHKG